MWPESKDSTKGENPPPLRTGLTTGSCATACCVAAATYLLGQQSPRSVSITLPQRKASEAKEVNLQITGYELLEQGVRTSTIKDAGDDPDVTHGATIFVELQLIPEKGIEFAAADGVGVITREGLSLPVGEPAINPVPRQMMTDHLQRLAAFYDYHGGFLVSVGVVNGEQIATKTMNPRLGIMGGLSILGTTGIVRPFSCAAWIASIYQGIDVANTNNCLHIAATTGNRSEQAIKAYYELPDMALIEMGDFAGAVLKHLKKLEKQEDVGYPLGIKKLSICGGFGKISKLSQGHMDLNSRASAIDLDYLASIAKDLGAAETVCQLVKNSNTSIEALKHCQQANIDLALALCQRAKVVAQAIVPEAVEVEVTAIDRQGNFVGSTNSFVMKEV